MGKSITSATQYKSGDGLDADWVNEITRRVLREISGGNAHGGPEGLVLGRAKRPPNVDRDGLYDLPLINTDEANAIQAYGVCQPDMLEPYQPIFMSIFGKRGVTVKQPYFANGTDAIFPLPWYAVCGPWGMPKDFSSLSGGAFGDEEASAMGSLLVLGGWVQASKKDEDGNVLSILQQGPTVNINDITWGPKPGSQCLWPYRNGFRLLTPPLDVWEDPAVDPSLIGYAYGYQTLVTRTPDVFWQGTWSILVSTTSYTALFDSWAPTDSSLWMRGFSQPALNPRCNMDAAVMMTVNGEVTFSTAQTVSIADGVCYLEVAPFVGGAQAGDSQRVWLNQVKDKDSNLVHISAALNRAWLVNLTRNKDIEIRGRLSDTSYLTSAAVNFGKVTMVRVSDFARKWQFTA